MRPLKLESNIERPLRLLCLGAHSDDIEIGCGGTLLDLLSRHTVDATWVVFGASGLRRDEAEKSCTAFLHHAHESQLLVKDFPNSYFPHHWKEIKDFIEVVKKQVSPDLIFTHYRNDLHQDHHTVSELTRNAFRDHTILEYEIPKFDGDLGSPNTFVTLPTDVCERKIALLMEHFSSQQSRSWFTGETFRGLMRIRGIECNAPAGYAEAFYSNKLVIA